MNERGVASVALVVLVVALALAVGSARFGRAAVERAQAQTVADAAALAGAVADVPCIEAEALTRANRGVLVSCRFLRDRIEIEVRVGAARAAAAAEAVD